MYKQYSQQLDKNQIHNGRGHSENAHASQIHSRGMTSFLNSHCYFFQHFLALFDPIATRYNDPDIKFRFSAYLYSYKHFIRKSFLKMNKICPSDLCGSPVYKDLHICYL